MGALSRVASVLAVALAAAGCTCACVGGAGATDAAAPDRPARDSSRDRGVDGPRDLWLLEPSPDGPRPDAPPLPACGGSRKLQVTPIVPYAPLPCGKGCEQITFGRWLELTYQVSGNLVVYPSLVSFFHMNVLDLNTRKEVEVSYPGSRPRNCPRMATDGTRIAAACLVFNEPPLGTFSRYSLSLIDPTSLIESDVYCKEIPLDEQPCTVDSLALGDVLGLTWNPGKCASRPHTLPLSGGPLTSISKDYGWLLSMSGSRIVWHARSGIYSNIVLYDPKTKQQSFVSPVAASQAYARIEGDQVVWVDARNSATKMLLVKGNHDIYHYNLSTKKETAITTDAAVQLEPDVSGDWVVWEDWRNTPGGDPLVDDSNSDIYAYNLKTKTEVQLTDFPGRELSPRVDNGRVFYRKLDAKGRANLFMIDLAKRLAKN